MMMTGDPYVEQAKELATWMAAPSLQLRAA